MTDKSQRARKAAGLRLRAENVVRKDPALHAAEQAAPAPGETRQTFHELRVHQIELEMQNEELRRAHAELDAARARYFDLYDLAPVGYCTLSADGVILEANLTAAILLGLVRGALMKERITRFVFKEDQDIYYLHQKELLETSASHACEIRMVKKDGTIFWVHLAATLATGHPSKPGRNAGGEPASWVVLSDITPRKQAEEERAKLETRLRQAQQLESLGALAGGVAHDFNNLLTVIMGNANLGRETIGSDSCDIYFETIETAALRAADLTRQLLAYAGKGKVLVTAVDIALLAQEATQLLSVAIPRNLVLRCELAEPLPPAKGDATRIFQILMNLITNASEAFADGVDGLITVSTGMETLDETAIASLSWVLVVMPGRYVTLEVADTGTGMAPEVLARVFEPFFTTKFTGRGLGLAFVIGALRTHEGGLSVRSDPGSGSSFKVFLPVAEEPPAVPEEVAVPGWKGEGRILVVDDEEAVRDIARTMSEHLGFSVIEACDGLDAIEIFRAHHAELAAVLLDLTMPRMGGREAFAEMRKMDDTVPIVLSSGYDVQGDADLPVEGLAGFLKKPYRMGELQAVLQGVVILRPPERVRSAVPSRSPDGLPQRLP